MRTSSLKAKGRRCSQEVKELLLKYAPELEDGDLNVTPSGVTGPDVYLSPKAKLVYPFAIECKNQESINIWASLTQAESHVASANEIPVLFFKRNRSILYMIGRAQDVIKLITAPCDCKGADRRAGIHQGSGPSGIPDPGAGE